ncbi:hypothetical protein SEA_SUNSHINE924_70 [Mycobacterium Phage Sunshine924]|nr:hypothetical protein SEA_BACONJACK_70 [Mycobacterium phage BaconJack]QXN72946.1 hypothetical protein SEA_SUNSHINE924_70 [Mycobacterium Phage Sunshine924]
MSDPAVEAARRVASVAHRVVPPIIAVESAREALKPLRKMHRPVQYINRQRCCLTCFDANGKPHISPCETAKLIYTTEELEQ